MPPRPIPLNARADRPPAPGPGDGQARRFVPASRSALASLPLVLTVPEVARVLRIRKQRAYELVASGALPSTRLGPRCVRVIRADLEDFLAQRPAARAPNTVEPDASAAHSAIDDPSGSQHQPTKGPYGPASNGRRRANRS